MMPEFLKVKEQNPTGRDGKKSIFCECKIENKAGTTSTVYSGQMYFICDAEKNITQYFGWMEGYKKELKELGYKL